MAGYPNVSKIKDDTTRMVLQNAFELIASLQQRLATLEGSALTVESPVDARNERIINVARPEALTDAANAQYVQAYTTAQVSTFGKGLTQDVDPSAVTTLRFSRGSLVEVIV